MKKTTLLLYALFLLIHSAFSQKVPDGNWYARLEIKPGLYIPFRLLTEEGAFYIINAEERIHLNETTRSGDSLFIPFPVFDSEIRAAIQDEKITGTWYNYSKGDYKMKVEAELTREAYPAWSNSPFELTGKWDAWFSAGTENESYMIGVFSEKDARITGTFLSETGDYRFLEGRSSKNRLYLSTFDGAHAYYFDFKFINKDSIVGTYYSGFRWQEPFTMRRNEMAKLRDPDSLTFLKEGYDRFEFAFKDLEGKTISHEQYKNKVTIVQIMGSWCSNCMDETRFFNELYEKHHKEGLEIVAISFERNDSYEDFKRNLDRLKRHLEVQYAILFGGSTKEAKDKLPMLNNIMSYPTAIFIDKQGRVRKIHTGFSGPGTGAYYEKYTDETTNFVTKLLEE